MNAKCENMQQSENGTQCKATGYLCRYIAADWRKENSPCLFHPMYLKCGQMKKMLEMIHRAKEGSKVYFSTRRKYGFYTTEVIDNLSGIITKLYEDGRMEVESKSLIVPMRFKIEDFTRILFLDRKDIEQEVIKQQERIEVEERIKTERREEDGRDNEKTE